MRLLVIADDLTGATDTGAQFAAAGIETHVLTRWDAPAPPSASVVVVNTSSRHVAPAEAADRIRRVADCPGATLYKKTDSVLRGNIAAELGALAAIAGSVLYVPAFPRAGRTVRDGVVRLDGVPVHETHFARDPLAPVRTSSVTDLLARAGCPVALVPLAALRAGTPLPPASGPRILVVDGETDDDLAQTARLAAGQPFAFAGPAAFATHLPGMIRLPGTPRPLPPLPAPALIVSGSITPTTFAQIDAALAAGIRGLSLPPRALLPHVVTPPVPEGEQSLLLHTCRHRDDVAPYLHLARELGIPSHDLAHHVTRELAAVAANLFRRHRFPSLVLLGGETSAAVLEALGVVTLKVLGEHSPGVNILSADFAGHPVAVVTKSGGFGPPNLLVDLLR